MVKLDEMKVYANSNQHSPVYPAMEEYRARTGLPYR